MAMGRQGDCQGDLVVAWSEMPRSPGHVFYDRLQEVLIGAGFDGYVEAICAPYYAQRNGAPSVPPGRYFRMHMVGYFEGIDSERGIEWRCSDSLSLRAFLRLETSERVPDHSWLSRTRGRLPHEVHDRVFGWVLSLLAEHGLVRGARIGVDASTMEANAALRHIVRRDTGEDYRAMLTRMARESGIETPSAEDLVRLDRKRKGRKLSNQAWVSETDPQARVAKMKNGTTHLAYKPEHAVDLDTGAVAAAELHPADKGDTRTIEGTLASAKSHLSDAGGQPSSDAPAECVADKGYHSRAVLKGLDGGPWTSRIAEPRRAAFSRWHGDEEARRAVYNNRARLQSGIGKEAMRKRAEIVERSFAHILDRGGMRRTWLRGRENIHKRYLIHVAGHNLGLLMRLLVGAGTPKEAVARGWGFFLAQSPGDGASNTAILLFWITSASDPDAIACVITESPKPAEPPFRQRAAMGSGANTASRPCKSWTVHFPGKTRESRSPATSATPWPMPWARPPERTPPASARRPGQASPERPPPTRSSGVREPRPSRSRTCRTPASASRSTYPDMRSMRLHGPTFRLPAAASLPEPPAAITWKETSMVRITAKPTVSSIPGPTSARSERYGTNERRSFSRVALACLSARHPGQTRPALERPDQPEFSHGARVPV